MVTFETYYYIITSITTIVHYFQLQLLLITSITSITYSPNLEMELRAVRASGESYDAFKTRIFAELRKRQEEVNAG